MHRFLRCLPLIILLGAPLQAIGGASASLQVSFMVVASCTVDARGAAAPGVDCVQADAFIVAHAQTPGASGAAGWTVYF